MPELEAALRSLGKELDYPPTPDLARAVRARLAAPAHQRWSFRLVPPAGGWRRLALAAALVLILAGAGLAAWAPARQTVAGWLGIRGVDFTRSPRHLVTPSPTNPVGVETTLAGAEARADFKVTFPAGLGRPAHVYYSDAMAGGVVSLVYGSGPGQVLVTEAHGRVDSNGFFKVLDPSTVLEPVTVAGQPGAWLTGHPHLIVIQDENGQYVESTLRLATNTLVWSNGGVTYRIEGASLSKDQALSITSGLG